MGVLRILGIDPGLARMGYGVVDVIGSRLQCVTYGCIETPAKTPVSVRLQEIYEQLTELIKEHRPSVMAVEELFLGRNTTTAFTVGQARGVALLCAALHETSIVEYTPMQVKQAVTGYGRAEKGQIQQMVKILLGLSTLPRPDDAADALAVAITHGHGAPTARLSAAESTEQTGWNWERGVRR